MDLRCNGDSQGVWEDNQYFQLLLPGGSKQMIVPAITL